MGKLDKFIKGGKRKKSYSVDSDGSPASPSSPRTRDAQGDAGAASMKGWPILFHETHSENIQLSSDRRRAKRIESFCKGICFSNRPIAVNERVHIRFAETSTSWSGVIRFGFTGNDPMTINGAELPRYACPDLTNKPGFWAKALPERHSEAGTVLFFYVTRSGDVMYGIQGEERGAFFSGVNTSGPLWAIVDIYGNTTAMEFIDGRELNNYGGLNSTELDMMYQQDLAQQMAGVSIASTGGGVGGGVVATQNRTLTHRGSMPVLAHLADAGNVTGFPVRFHASCPFTPVPFHTITGRNVCLNSDKTIAVRLVEEYCNGYVFTSRPMRMGEKFVMQILAIDRAYSGGLTFGMTACDPSDIPSDQLPDDSDLLLDRPEYWVVNKDVCSAPEVGDELSFHMTEEGEIRYGKNGHTIATLMFVDKTLPLWAFFDVYGSTQKIKSLGILSGAAAQTARRSSLQQQSQINTVSGGTAAGVPAGVGVPGVVGGSPGGVAGLTVALPPPRAPSSPSPSQSSISPPPPRPPPPRQSASPSTRRASSPPAGAPPSLPPKQYHQRPVPAQPPPPGTILIPTPVSAAAAVASNSPAAPAPAARNVRGPTSAAAGLSDAKAPTPSPAPRPTPAAPSSTAGASPTRILTTQQAHRPTHRPGAEADQSEEAADNASNECSVCLDKPVDCVIYTCGHMCVCYECALDIKENQGALCPICRREIMDIIKIYRS